MNNSQLPPEKTARSFRIPAYANWLIYAGIAFSILVNALVGIWRPDSDHVVYLDLADAVRGHQWHTLVNAYWFPLYPAMIAVSRAILAHSPQHELMAVRLLNAVIGVLLVLSTVFLADSIRRLAIARGFLPGDLLPPRILSVWSATLAYFFFLQDLAEIHPDALLFVFMILALAMLVRGVVDDRLWPYLAVGLFGGLAYWTKAFAFPFFILLIVFGAAASFRKPRILLRLAVSLALFLLIVSPYISKLSAAKGRFTFGDSGRLNLAWFINGADRFNPVADPSLFHPGTANLHLVHPGQLLAKSPEITYFDERQVPGSTPQWDDPSYWSDGLASRFSVRGALANMKANIATLCSLGVMRMQAGVLIATLACWGFALRRRSLCDPLVLAICLIALACIGLYSLVLVEGRYTGFSFIVLSILFAAASTRKHNSPDLGSLHVAVLLVAGLLVIVGVQENLREWRTAQQEGAQPLKGIYESGVYAAGADLAVHFPRGTQVACMGDEACWHNPYWARYAGLQMTGIVESGNGWELKSAEQACPMLAENPSALDALRQHQVKAIVAKFDGVVACSSDWRRLGKTPNYFYLPL